MSDEREMRERYERELQEARAKIEVLEKEKNERAAREQKEKEPTQQETRQNPSGGQQPTTQPTSFMAWGDRSGPPKFPRNGDGTVQEVAEKRWMGRLTRFISTQGLGEYLAQPGESSPDVIHTFDHRQLYGRFTEDLVTAHVKIFQILCFALEGSPLEDEISSCTSVPAAWSVIQRWCLPLQDGDKELAIARFENVKMIDDENPKFYFARVMELANTLLSVQEYRTPEEIARVAIRGLSRDYDIEKRSTLAGPGIRLEFVRHVIQKSYSERKVRELKEPMRTDGGKAAAVPAIPHALAAFSGAQGGGGRGGGRGFGGYHGGRGPQPGDGAYLAQQRSWQGGSMPMPQQGPPPLGRGGGRGFGGRGVGPSQLGGGNGRSGAPWAWTYGKGGMYDCGSNCVYDQPTSPPPPGSPQGTVCLRPGRT